MTYDEFLIARESVALNNKVRVAVIIAANTVRGEAGATVNHAKRMLWARTVFVNPDDAARSMMNAVLAANIGATLAATTGATDAQVQSAVDLAVNVMAGE